MAFAGFYRSEGAAASPGRVIGEVRGEDGAAGPLTGGASTL